MKTRDHYLAAIVAGMAGTDVRILNGIGATSSEHVFATCIRWADELATVACEKWGHDCEVERVGPRETTYRCERCGERFDNPEGKP